MEQNYFKRMESIPTRVHFEKKGNLDYLPWSIAWSILKREYSTANYRVIKNNEELNYHHDGRTCWVETEVDAFGVTLPCQLAVMDNRNKAIPFEKVTSTDIQNSAMRCLTKNIALHGIGLNAWTNEPDQKLEMSKEQFDSFMKSADKKDVVNAYATYEFTSEQKSIIKTKFK